MKITFITTSLGVFGSIRELLENANRLVDYGHDVIIHSDLKKYPFTNWLNCKAKLKQLGRIAKTDALIMMDTPFNYHMDHFSKCNAKFKTIVMMGFESDFMLKLGNNLYNYSSHDTEKNLLKILNDYEICADSNYQLSHLKKLGVKTGVAIGGINLSMFRDQQIRRTIHIGYSGDTRKRKGTETIINALNELSYKNRSYYGQGNQDYLITFLNKCDLFIDNHMQGGWINPVLEAMACNCVTICRNIPALSEFANDKTSIVLKNPNQKDFIEAIENIINDKYKKAEIRENAKQQIKQFDYKIVSKNFEKYLFKKI